jgi:hypothetical protein
VVAIVKMRILLFLIDTVLVNLAFLLSFLIRYGLSFPKDNFLPYKNSFIFLMLIYIYQHWLFLEFIGAWKV